MKQTSISTAVSATLADTLRWTKDIGMFALDRSREHSCIHATAFCEATCFNEKLEKAFGHAIAPKDIRNDIAWTDNNAYALADAIARKRNQTKRARFMTRGEAFRDASDIERVCNILRATPETIWWVPTRAWRDPILFVNIRNALAEFSNVRLLASTDPSTTDAEYRALERKGLSTMFYGDDTRTKTPSGARMFRCPKTHRHIVGHCAVCKAGCFKNGQVHVHLKQH